MDFTTIPFLAFLAAAALVYHLAPSRLRPMMVLVSSYIFYWLNSHALLCLLVGNTIMIFLAALWMHRTKSQAMRSFIAFAAVALIVGMLIFYKATPLLGDGWARNILVPLGISYYTFKLVGYLVDVYQRVSEPETDLISFAAFAAFFPQIVAGPIQRAEHFLPQTHPPVTATRATVLLGCQRILLGFFKKFIVADNLATLVNFLYQHLHTTREPILLAFYGYPLQMYADFSALTDISIGAALLFGIVAPENFEAPFSSVSPSEYWRRWHISLTLWLTDYVFTPLRMSARRLGNSGLVLSLILNMVLIGLWHGFRWNFVIFGLVHAFFLSVDALTGRARREFYKKNPQAKIWAGRFGPITTFHLIAIGFVCFRAPTFGDIVFVLGHLFAGLTQWSTDFTEFLTVNGHAILVGIFGYAVAECGDWLRRRNARSPILLRLPRWGRWSVYSCSTLAVCLLIMLLFVNGAKRSPFLYAIF